MPAYGLPDDQVKMIASAVYGENRGQGDSAILHTASSVFNRIGNNEWAGKSVPEILLGGYAAVKDTSKNSGFKDAMTNHFPDTNAENEFKRIYAKVAAMNRGKIEPTDTQFYFNQKEINRLAKKGGFDFEKVKEGEPFSSKVGKFRTFSYK